MESDCRHLDFKAQVEVSRIDDAISLRLSAAVQIECAQCGARFVFEGLPRGINLGEPTSGVFGLQAHLPIRAMKQEDFEPEMMIIVVD